MLVLSRKRDKSIIIGDDIQIVIVDIRCDKVLLGIIAPDDVRVLREEIAKRIERDLAESKKGGGAE